MAKIKSNSERYFFLLMITSLSLGTVLFIEKILFYSFFLSTIGYCANIGIFALTYFIVSLNFFQKHKIKLWSDFNKTN